MPSRLVCWLMLCAALTAACASGEPASPPAARPTSINTTVPHNTATALSTPLASPSPSPTEDAATATLPAEPTRTQTPRPASPPPPSPPTLTVIVPRPAPTVITFTVAPAEIDPGQPVTLTWQATGEGVVIYPLNALGQMTLPSFNGPAAGSWVVTPSAQLREAAQFILFAVAGSQTSAGASAAVRLRCPDTWFFATAPAACPASPPQATVMQAQHFEHGLMLWTEWNRRIYVLYADGQSPSYDVLDDLWTADQPENDPALQPPAGLYQPVRGFGLVWRTGSVSPRKVIRDRLGWAIDQEAGVPGAHFQCGYAPKYVTCYLSGPGGLIYRLQPERSGWDIWPP